MLKFNKTQVILHVEFLLDFKE